MKMKHRGNARNVRIWALTMCLLSWLPTTLRAQKTAAPSSVARFQALEKQATEASSRGQTRPAIALYLQALRLQPQWAKGWREVGVLLAQVKDYPRAIVAFGNSLRLEPKDGDAWALRGLCEYELSRYPQALDDIQHGRELGLRNPALEQVATYHAALIFILNGQFDVADHLLEHLAREGVNNPDLIAAFGLASLRIPRLPGQWTDTKQQSLALQVGRIAWEAVQAPPAKIIPQYEVLIQKYPRARGLHYAFGEYLLDYTHYRRALGQMQDELKLNPDDVMALLQTALTEVKLNEPGRALPYAEKAVHLAPRLFAAHWALGTTLLALNHARQSLPELKAAVQLAPNSPQAHYALSRAYVKLGDDKDALRESKIFVKLKQEPTVAANFQPRNRNLPPSDKPAAPAESVKAIFLEAEQNLQEGHYGPAEVLFKQVLAVQPNFPPALCDLGVVCLRTHRLDQAIRYFQTARRLAPKLAGLDLDLGLAYYQKKDFKDAIPEFSAVLETDPQNLQARYLMGLCYFVLDQYAEVIRALQPLWTHESRNLAYLFVMGISYGKLKHNRQCERVFERLVEVGGNSPHFHLLLGRAYEGLYWNQQAYQELKKAVAGDPKLPDAHYSLGMVDMRLGKLPQAGREFDAEIALNPRSPWAYQKRGVVDLYLNQPQQAVEMFQKALARNPKLPQSLAGIAKAYFMQGKFQAAIGYYQKALALQPDKASYHYQLGQTYLHLGNRAGAQREFATAQKLQAASLQKQQKEMAAPPPVPQSR